MKTKYLIPAIVITLIMSSCGSKEESKENKEEGKEQSDEQVEETPVEEITYAAFDSTQLEGNWKVIDAQAYSKDQMIGQTYSFNGDTATFFKNTGDVGMAKGYYKIKNGEVTIRWERKDSNGTGRVTFYYKGGFFEDGKKLQLNASDQMITLERQ